jgi:hypothetical protein
MTCPVLFIRKEWWSRAGLSQHLAKAIDAWADQDPEPGNWPHWLPADVR